MEVGKPIRGGLSRDGVIFIGRKAATPVSWMSALNICNPFSYKKQVIQQPLPYRLRSPSFARVFAPSRAAQSQRETPSEERKAIGNVS